MDALPLELLHEIASHLTLIRDIYSYRRTCIGLRSVTNGYLWKWRAKMHLVHKEICLIKQYIIYVSTTNGISFRIRGDIVHITSQAIHSNEIRILRLNDYALSIEHARTMRAGQARVDQAFHAIVNNFIIAVTTKFPELALTRVLDRFMVVF